MKSQHTPGSKNEQITTNSLSTPKKAKGRKTQSKQRPLVSICTITYNRTEYFPLLLKCIENQDYPLDRIEWVILDDSDAYTEELNITSDTSLQIKYKKLEKHVPLGTKRNMSHKLCSGEYIVYMDDDDYYYPERVSHAVDTLTKSEKDIAGSTQLLIYFTHDDQIWLSGPFHSKHATANTFAMTKNFASQHFYENEAICNEEKSFLNNYTIPMAQLDPSKTIICLSHNTNTFDKRRMRSKGPTKNMRPLTPEESKPLLLRLGQSGHQSKHKIPKTIITTGSKAQIDNSSIQSAWAEMQKNLKEWDIQIYTDEEAEDFIRNNYGHNVYSAYQKINPDYGAAKADFFRYCVIYKLGGIYIDIKSYISNDPSLFIKKTDELLLSHWDNEPGQAHANWGKWKEINTASGEFINWLIIAKKKHPFLRKVIETITNNIHQESAKSSCLMGKQGVLRLTGPIAYTNCLQECIEKSKYPQHRLINYSKYLIYYSIFEKEKNISFIQMDEQFKGSKLRHESNHYSQKTTPILLKETITERIATEKNLKLNLGCGNKKLKGFINIDQSEKCLPDLLLNLENTPYPFTTSSAEYIKMDSVLEHFPVNPQDFFRIMREIHRISKNNANIDILCPHPFHRWQIVDFTHQKPISLEGLKMLDKAYCRELIRKGNAKTPLALIYDVDFVVKSYQQFIDPECKKHIANVLGEFDDSKIDSYTFLFNNIIGGQRIILQTRKDES